MNVPNPLGIYRPGDGPLHRLRPGAKLLGLLVFATAVMTASGAFATSVVLAVALALTLLAGLRGRELWRVVRGFAIVALLLLAFHVWQTGWERGAEVVGDLFALVLAASAVTASTPVGDMLDTIVWLLTPLRPLGVRPERVAFAFSLMITAIPSILGIAGETRSAARARGLERNARAVLVPFVLRTVAHARAIGLALHARGLGDD